MTPLVKRVMETVKLGSPRTYEQWMGLIVNTTLDEAAKSFGPYLDAMISCGAAIEQIKSLKDQEPCE